MYRECHAKVQASLHAHRTNPVTALAKTCRCSSTSNALYTLLALLSVPARGGDTAWVLQVAAYERLSEPIKRLLEGLEAEHDGFRQAENARRDGKCVRREPVGNNHPIVRVHPVSSLLSSHKLEWF